MNVVRLPPVEPWPTELFETYSILDLEALIDGAHAEIVKRRSAAADAAVDTCGDCGEYVHPSESICAACGAPRVPKNERQVAQSLDGISAPPAEEVNVTVDECECGTCARCSLRSYEPDIKVLDAVHDSLEAAIARPGNVAELRRWSVKANG